MARVLMNDKLSTVHDDCGIAPSTLAQRAARGWNMASDHVHEANSGPGGK